MYFADIFSKMYSEYVLFEQNGMLCWCHSEVHPRTTYL